MPDEPEKKQEAPAPEPEKHETEPPATHVEPLVVPPVLGGNEGKTVWQVSKEDWETHQGRLAKLEERFGGLDGIMGALNPLLEAIAEENAAEQSPSKKKSWWKTKLFG